MNDKNKQLAELLGIEPNFDRCDHCAWEYEDSNCEINCGCDAQIYPDFTKPENFVKLLEMLFSFFEEMDEVIRKHDETYCEALMEYLIDGIQNMDVDDLIKFKLQKAAQQVDWVY